MTVTRSVASKCFLKIIRGIAFKWPPLRDRKQMQHEIIGDRASDEDRKQTNRRHQSERCQCLGQCYTDRQRRHSMSRQVFSSFHFIFIEMISSAARTSCTLHKQMKMEMWYEDCARRTNKNIVFNVLIDWCMRLPLPATDGVVVVVGLLKYVVWMCVGVWCLKMDRVPMHWFTKLLSTHLRLTVKFTSNQSLLLWLHVPIDTVSPTKILLSSPNWNSIVVRDDAQSAAAALDSILYLIDWRHLIKSESQSIEIWDYEV